MIGFRKITTATILVVVLMSSLSYGGGNRHCHDCGRGCASHQMVKKTIVKPMQVTELRVKSRVIRKHVEREEEYTAFKRVPKERKITEDCWYLDDEVRQQEVEKKSGILVNQDVNSDRNMLRPVRVDQYCTKCNGQVCKCTKTYLDEFIKREKKDEPTVLFPSVKRLVDYCRKTPKKHEIEKATETVMTLQPVTLKRKVMVCVPEIVKETVEVQVWKDINYDVWVCDECKKLPETTSKCKTCK